jgi:hypothetical protein
MNLSLGELSTDLMRAYFSATKSYQGLSVMEEDWDTLLILDACRYDMFDSIVDIPGTTRKRRSQASATDDFLKCNFGDGPYFDTVYVTANPRLDTTSDVKSMFHEVVDVWRTDWDEDLETVPPEVMTERTLEAHRDFPDKRIIAHFMQPHGPFIGEMARDEIGIHSGIANHKRKALNEDERLEDTYIWELVRQGVVGSETAKQAYEQNLNIVVPHLKRLITSINGKIIITSDHGNMLGERAWPFPLRVWGHPNGILTKELTEVPWHTVNSDDRRPVVSEEPEQCITRDLPPEIESRLEQLGYKQNS